MTYAMLFALFYRALSETPLGWTTELNLMWPSMIEIVNITQNHGGPEDITFSDNIATEAIRKWKNFRDFLATESGSIDEMNDRFFRYQHEIFERIHGRRADKNIQRHPHKNVTWPELEQLSEYQRLRRYIEAFGRRYLRRIGFPDMEDLNIFSWAAVHSHADFHGPHTHTGELLVGVYYARVNKGSGRLRLFDPRGQIVPFGKTYDFDCHSGQMIFFPSWLQHEALPTKGSDGEHRVIFAFNIGIGRKGDFKSMEWGQDPVSGFISSATYPVEDPLVDEILKLRPSNRRSVDEL
jgi:hypothetical protein